jgi:hypothetical protein
MITLEVNVTQDHIDRGAPCSCYSCPIALAVSDAVGSLSGADRIIVDRYTLSLIDDTAVLIGELPKEAVQFIHDFDDTELAVKPFKFSIDLKEVR